MAIDTLTDFVAALDRAGELVRVTQPVSLDREMCEIADRVMKQPGGGKALLFERPVLMNGRPSAFPVVKRYPSAPPGWRTPMAATS